VTGLGAGFKALGKSALDSFFAATDNPFVGLTVGILGTTLAQSSSVSTSMIVGLVAAGQLDVGNAVPMIMGANIGTTVTNTIVSLGHITRPEEFRRAFAAATCHDFFNFMTVAIMLPLELATGVLEKTASTIAVAIAGTSGGKFPNPLKDATKAALEPLVSLLEAISDSERFVAIGLIVLSIALIFVTLGFIVKTLRAVASERMESIVARSLGHNVYTGLIVGVIVTIMVQSSSITTSVMVPLAGAGLIRLEQVFPITVGANIGTTVTALIASLAAPPETLHLALTIALVHLLFNVAGVLLVFVTPQTRQIPLRAARWLADVAVRSRKYALLYVVLLFYGVPALLIFLPKLF
jgi:sodium-dependent phosphate cotransporter